MEKAKADYDYHAGYVIAGLRTVLEKAAQGQTQAYRIANNASYVHPPSRMLDKTCLDGSEQVREPSFSFDCLIEYLLAAL